MAAQFGAHSGMSGLFGKARVDICLQKRRPWGIAPRYQMMLTFIRALVGAAGLRQDMRAVRSTVALLTFSNN